MMDFDALFGDYPGEESTPEDEHFYETDSDRKVDVPKHLIKKFAVDVVDMPSIKEEVTDEACVPALVSRPMSSIQKVPSLSDLSDPESSLGKSLRTPFWSFNPSALFRSRNRALKLREKNRFAQWN
ncbi:UNVERIFIED_CONTAM: hypothetical protein PYX00_007420 [Menopon gallinae]|uniref:Uncharacterized protein n=1 Tax=Menopon gallinae TaxID=328185 RepID=A0AAW2HJT1_9NEOP